MISLTAPNGALIKYETATIERSTDYWDDCTKAINAVQGATQMTVDLTAADRISYAGVLRSKADCLLQDPALKVVFDNVVELNYILDTPGERFRNTRSLHVKFSKIPGCYSRKIYGYKLQASFPSLKTLLLTVQPGNAVLISNLGYWPEQPSCIINNQLQACEHDNILFELGADNKPVPQHYLFR